MGGLVGIWILKVNNGAILARQEWNGIDEQI